MNGFQCMLCLEHIKNANKEILCTKCDNSCCSACFRTYMLHCRDDPQCPNPNCDHIHGTYFLRSKLPQTFWNNKGYKKSRIDVLYNHEKMYKDATMAEVTRYKNQKTLTQISYNYGCTKRSISLKEQELLDKVLVFAGRGLYKVLDKRIASKKLARVYTRGAFYNWNSTFIAIQMHNKENWSEFKKVLDDAINQILQLNATLETQRIEWVTLKDQLSADTTIQDRVPNKPKCKVPCHVNGCAGICTGSVCPICSSKTCPRCHQKLDDHNHICNQDDVETVKEITTNSKPCPTCNEAISKVHGCDQMLCTSCHTAFSWKTGKIDKGRVHNPHYYEIRRRIGRELGDEVCGGLVDWHRLKYDCFEQPKVFVLRRQRDMKVLNGDPIPKKLRMPFVSEDEMLAVTKHYRIIVHIRAVIFPLLVNLDHNFHTNLKARVQYYLKEIDKSQFEKVVFKNEKQRTMNIELRDLLQTFVTVSEEIFRKIYDSGLFTTEYLPELKGILEYLCEQYKVIAHKYKSQKSLDKYTKWKDVVTEINRHLDSDNHVSVKVEDIYQNINRM